MHINVHVSLQYIILSFFGQIKAFIFSKRFLFQPNVHQVTAADTMIRFWT